MNTLDLQNAQIADGVEASRSDTPALRSLKEAMSHATVSTALATVNGRTLALPEPLFLILQSAASMLLQGERVTLAPVTKELSTQEAADLLNVSRPYLITLLDSGMIPYTKVGRNRRVCFGHVVEFRSKRDAERRQRLHDMIRKSEDLGLYDFEEASIEPTR